MTGISENAICASTGVISMHDFASHFGHICDDFFRRWSLALTGNRVPKCLHIWIGVFMGNGYSYFNFIPPEPTSIRRARVLNHDKDSRAQAKGSSVEYGLSEKRGDEASLFDLIS